MQYNGVVFDAFVTLSNPTPSTVQTTIQCSRQAELRDHRRAGIFPVLTNYVSAVSSLPTDLPLWCKIVEQAPDGYDVLVYGLWPGPCWLLKIRYAPTWKSHLDQTNWHTVTMLVTVGPNPNNIFHLGPLLSRIFAVVCNCLAGAKTNSCCSHIMAMVKSLMAPACFRSRKVHESRLTDIYR